MLPSFHYRKIADGELQRDTAGLTSRTVDFVVDGGCIIGTTRLILGLGEGEQLYQVRTVPGPRGAHCIKHSPADPHAKTQIHYTGGIDPLLSRAGMKVWRTKLTRSASPTTVPATRSRPFRLGLNALWSFILIYSRSYR
jgi:hypothetical protein